MTTEAPKIDFGLFFEKSLDLLVVAGFDGHFKRVSDTWLSTFGWTLEELLLKPSVEFVHVEDREATLSARRALHDARPWTGLTNRYVCRDGTYRWLEWKSIAQPDRQLIYAVARDVTEQRRAEQERRRMQAELIFAERMSSVGRLAGGVAHEINNPLSCVIANLDTLVGALESQGGSRAEPGSEHSEHRELLTEALSGARRVKNIVQGLRTFAGSDEEQRKLTHVRPVLELSLSMVASDIRRRASVVEAYGVTPLIEADQSRLGQVFLDLLVNAGQAMAGTDTQANEIRIATSTDGMGWAQIEVSDTGTGIPDEVRAHIFDPFFTTKGPGPSVGLGLSMCRTIIIAMGGTIELASHEGRGTTVRVVLPPAGWRSSLDVAGADAPPTGP